jgi:hypothetical protein
MRRRRVLAIGSLAGLLPLAACAGGQLPTPSIGVVANDVKIIATGLQGVMNQLGALSVPGLTPQVLNTCQTSLAGLQTCAAAIANASSAVDAKPTVEQVEGYVNAFVGALAVLPLPAPVNTALVAATILLPVIEAAVGLAISNAPPATMTPDQARSALATTGS